MSAAYRVALLATALAFASGVTSTRALAQGFFQSIFGFGGSQPSARSANRPASMPRPDFRYRQPAAPPSSAMSRPEPSVQDGGKYRTMCVRMCDGYYFPISASVTRRSFYRDAHICKKSCGTEAALFYHRGSSGDARTMIDLTGRAYIRLPNALRYRKQLVSGCKCRPEPWTPSEMARHHRYAIEAAREVAQSLANTEGTEAASLTVAKVNLATEGNGQPTSPAGDVINTRSDDEVEARADEAISAPQSEHPPAPVDTTLSRKPKAIAPKPSVMRPSCPPAVRQAETPRRPPPRAPKLAHKPAQPAPFGLGLGGQKLRWPGD